MDDRTLPRMPVVVSAEAVGVKVAPTCMVCRTPVPDLTDPKHHVCVPVPDRQPVPADAITVDGVAFMKSTRDVGEKDQRAVQAAADAAAAAAVKPVVP